jgi:Translation elongation factors (GTPases)
MKIAQVWEYYQLNKFNFEPPYQREGDVWTETKKSFLIDTILKNYPMPPIFLRQKIDSNGKTMYDVIDGKQRLTSIISFINGDISLPDNFSEDNFGSEFLNGAKFIDLDVDNLKEWKKEFWRYEITIEYIDSDEDEIIDNIFDRLNRNGEPLTGQELRKAKYNSTPFYEMAVKLSATKFWKENLSHLRVNRYDDVEFISELIFVILENGIPKSGSRTKDKSQYIDDLYKKYCLDSNLTEKDIDKCISDFHAITDILKKLNLNFNSFKIDGVSHLYGLWCFSWNLFKSGNKNSYSEKIISFFFELRDATIIEKNVYIEEYRISMQSQTKSKSSRLKRVNSLLGYCNLSPICD